ncbi:MAG: hypothetical protein SFY81_13745 [Verrucomicrobiota bacterium]|nr:hypothetical protein [Verrucomicrobiota bacterium]
MTWLRILFLPLLLAQSLLAAEAEGRIIKVLPHFLDQEGRHTLHPSLYERDAYQAFLRSRPEDVSALRYDIQWKAGGSENLILKLEYRGSKMEPGETKSISRPVKKRWFGSSWSAIQLNKAEYDQAGAIIAWRVSIWKGTQLLADQKSFLW